jgi:hypothetical protein
MQPTKLLVLDLETDNSNNLGLQIWHPEFKVVSCSFYLPESDKKHFTQDFEEMRNALSYFDQEGYTFVIFNAMFDCTILKHVFGVADVFSRSIDVWRLVSYCDMRVDDKHSKKKERDTSLPGAVKYFFGVDDFKMPYLSYFIDQGLVRSKKPKQQKKEAHAMVGSLPSDLLEAYNNADVEWTWKLYLHCTKLLEGWGIDWQDDYDGYINETSLYSAAFLRGIRVDREMLASSIQTLKQEIAAIDTELRKDPAVAKAEELVNPKFTKVTRQMIKKHKEECSDLWFMGEPTAEEILEWARKKKWHALNWKSSKDKIALFIDVFGCQPTKLTEKGAPEMSTKTLRYTNEFGNGLVRLLKKAKELEECERIWILSSVDGRLHQALRSGTTVSSRSSSSMV